MFQAAAELADHIGTIIAHMRYVKGLKKPKNKGKNPYYNPYHCADVVGGDSGPAPMELGKNTLRCCSCEGLHY